MLVCPRHPHCWPLFIGVSIYHKFSFIIFYVQMPQIFSIKWWWLPFNVKIGLNVTLSWSSLYKIYSLLHLGFIVSPNSKSTSIVKCWVQRTRRLFSFWSSIFLLTIYYFLNNCCWHITSYSFYSFYILVCLFSISPHWDITPSREPSRRH